MSDAMNQALYESFQKNAVSRSLSSNFGPLLRPLGKENEIRDFFKELQGDCEWIDAAIEKLSPSYKGSSSVSYFTEDGWERHDYSRTESVAFDSSAPLLGLEHLGKEPMMFLVARAKNRPSDFGVMRQIINKLTARFEEAKQLDWSELGWDFSDSNSIVEPFEPLVKLFFPDLDWSNVENAMVYLEVAGPSLARLANVWETKVLPALSGEQAIVLSGGGLKAKQWYKDMSPSVEPLPLPELAVSFGIKDWTSLKAGMTDVFESFDEMVEAMRVKSPNSIPAGYKVPRPAQTDTAAGKKFGYEIPADCPVPKELMPHVLFAGDYVIESYSDLQSSAMASVTKLSVMPGIIDANAKQSSVTYINLGKIFDFARPWVRYALIEGMESLEDSIIEETDLYQLFGDNYDLTGKDLLSAWTVLAKIGEFSSVTRSLPNGGSHIRSVYKSQKPE